MSTQWLNEMQQDTANRVANLLDAVRDRVPKDYPVRTDVDDLERLIAGESSLAVQRAQRILEWMSQYGTTDVKDWATKQLDMLRQDAGDYFVVADPRT